MLIFLHLGTKHGSARFWHPRHHVWRCACAQRKRSHWRGCRLQDRHGSFRQNSPTGNSLISLCNHCILYWQVKASPKSLQIFFSRAPHYLRGSTPPHSILRNPLRWDPWCSGTRLTSLSISLYLLSYTCLMHTYVPAIGVVKGIFKAAMDLSSQGHCIQGHVVLS